MIQETPVNIEGTVRLRRAPKTLKEVTVIASKIMMVNKEDTIVYNADYFQLAEGSMLDALISQLPGVKLEKGGRITINGNFVSSLLINGKDFFKGDPTVALENLPAYMVNKVKAYQKAPDNAYITRDSLKANASDPWVIDGNLAIRYRQKSVALSFATSAKWQHAESEREGFTTINSLDMLYGLTANVTFPWSITLNTDRSLYTRGGYSDETMNTHEWIWNAELSKSFLRKKSLVIRLRGYDLLHQRHNVVRTLNAQGRTETWYNTIPRYMMLTMAYRLNIQPKRAHQ